MTVGGSSAMQHFVTVGRKLRNSLAKSGATMRADFEVRDPVPFAEARRLGMHAPTFPVKEIA